jgi:uncharacterized protein involved in exopolysaccharide biosynthesis
MYAPQGGQYSSEGFSKQNGIALSDILLTISEQLKVIFLTIFITVFLSFTHVQFIQDSLYTSSAKVLLPDNQSPNLGGLAGLATQFGVNVPSSVQADLSSPALFPDLIKSRTFGEKILNKIFYTEKYDEELSLLAILTYGNSEPLVSNDKLINEALKALPEILSFQNDSESAFSTIKVVTFEPGLAKQIAQEALKELEALNRLYKSQSVNEKIGFITHRIFNVKNELRASEQALKLFNEQNRQVTSPALELESDRLSREAEIQKGIYLTLKQQLELAKIEEVQEASLFSVLDQPKLPIEVSNKNLKRTILVALILGSGLGIFFGFVRSYLNNNNIYERRKLRKVKNFIRSKSKEMILDRRVSAIISIVLIIYLPYYLGHESSSPDFFGKYSANLMILIFFYLLLLITFSAIFVYLTFKKKN